jgi:Trypsin-like peptidase domain
MLDINRVVEVKGRGEGTGYLISPQLVLTARHVIAADGNRPADVGEVRVRILGDYLERQGEHSLETRAARVIWPAEATGRDYDYALLKTEAATRPVAPVAYSALPDTGSLKVEAIGFPNAGIFKRFLGSRSIQERDTWPIDGNVLAGTGAKQKALNIGTFEVLLSRDHQPRAGLSGWPGMSGASLFAGSDLIGIITETSQVRETYGLAALPAERLFASEEVRRAVQQAGLVLPRPAAQRHAAHPEQLEQYLHLLDRSGISTELKVRLDDLHDRQVKPPLFLCVRGRSDDDLSLLFQRIREKDLQEYYGDGGGYLVKEVAWPETVSSAEGGRRHLLENLKEALVENPKERRSQLTPERVRELVPGDDSTLFVYSGIPTERFAGPQLDLLRWWQGFWQQVAESGLRIVVFVAFEDQQRTDECCRNSGLECLGVACGRSPGPPDGIDGVWQCIGQIESIEFDEVDKWLRRELAAKGDWKGMEASVGSRLAAIFAARKRLPRGLRCLRLGLPTLLKELSSG